MSVVEHPNPRKKTQTVAFVITALRTTGTKKATSILQITSSDSMCALHGVLNSVNMLARQHGYRRCSVLSSLNQVLWTPRFGRQMRASNLKPVLDLWRRSYAKSCGTVVLHRRVGKSVRNGISLRDISWTWSYSSWGKTCVREIIDSHK